MIDPAILSIMQTAAIASVAASSVPALPIKCVAIAFTPPNDQKWLEIVFLPNNRNGDHWGKESNYRGTMRLILHWPNDSAGPYVPMTLASEIAAVFDKGTLLQNVQIYEKPDLTGVMDMGAETLYPVSVRYQCFNQ